MQCKVRHEGIHARRILNGTRDQWPSTLFDVEDAVEQCSKWSDAVGTASNNQNKIMLGLKCDWRYGECSRD